MAGKIFTKADFDRVVDRTGTDSIKWDGRQRVFGKADVIPMWVADMDFETPEFIRQRIAKRLEHPVLGYTYRNDRFAGSFTGWVQRQLDWTVDPAWVTFMPGVVAAVSVAVLAYTLPEDEVIIQPPVYHPFYFCVEGHGRKLILNHLKLENNRFTFDLELLKKQITPRTKMLILSSPHNPGGTVWTREELEGLVAVCREHNIWIISDEIHSDLVFAPNRHLPLISVAPDFAHRILVTMAPSKTFNLAAMSTSVVVISDKDERKKYEDLVYHLHVGMGNVFGIEALEAAYEEGDQWLDELISYLTGNRQLIHDFLQNELPQIKMMVPEATYMAWLDFSALGMKQDDLTKFMIHEAGLGLNSGTQFGAGGEGWMRLNFGCPRSILEEGLTQLKTAIDGLM
jgi:cystathionine beta-lyase